MGRVCDIRGISRKALGGGRVRHEHVVSICRHCCLCSAPPQHLEPGRWDPGSPLVMPPSGAHALPVPSPSVGAGPSDALLTKRIQERWSVPSTRRFQG